MSNPYLFYRGQRIFNVAKTLYDTFSYKFGDVGFEPTMADPAPGLIETLLSSILDGTMCLLSPVPIPVRLIPVIGKLIIFKKTLFGLVRFELTVFLCRRLLNARVSPVAPQTEI